MHNEAFVTRFLESTDVPCLDDYLWE